MLDLLRVLLNFVAKLHLFHAYETLDLDFNNNSFYAHKFVCTDLYDTLEAI